MNALGNLKTFRYNLNDSAIVNGLLEKLRNHIAASEESDNRLVHSPRYFFSLPDGSIAPDAGWYIILDGKTPLYVGTSYNLNSRLNSPSGSVDNFARRARIKDSERNFIKKFSGPPLLIDKRPNCRGV
jgi:hypothetical protein